jgi:hypothetical protein
MTATVAPFPKHQFFDTNGDPLTGAKLFTYLAGTSTKATTYQDANQVTDNANPLTLDAAGRCSLFQPIGTSYKYVLAPSTDTDPPASPYWTVDNVTAVPTGSSNLEVSGTAGETLTEDDLCYISDGSGGQTIGRWYKADKDQTYSSTEPQVLGFCLGTVANGGTTTFRVIGEMTGLSGLTAGTVYYVGDSGALTSTAPTNARPVGVANTTTTLIMSQWVLAPEPAAETKAIIFQIGAPGGGVISTGVKGYVQIPVGFHPTGWTLLADASGSIVIDVWADSYANFPPVVADSIAGSEKPTLSAAQKGQDLTLTTWSDIDSGDVIAFNVDSAATVQCVWLTIRGTLT